MKSEVGTSEAFHCLQGKSLKYSRAPSKARHVGQPRGTGTGLVRSSRADTALPQRPCHGPHTWSWHRRPPRSKAVRAPSENAPQPRPALARPLPALAWPFPALPCFQVPFVPASAGAWFAACRWCYRPAFPRSQSSAEEPPPPPPCAGSRAPTEGLSAVPGVLVTR